MQFFLKESSWKDYLNVSKSKISKILIFNLGWFLNLIRSQIKNSRWRRLRKCGHVGKEPRRRTGIGLTDFHGRTNYARVTHKSILTMSCDPKRQKSSGKQPWWRLSDLGSNHDCREAIPKHHGTMTSSVSSQNELKTMASPSLLS